MEKKKVSLIALDMDGTLLMSDKSIHPDTVRELETILATERTIGQSSDN